MHLILPFFLCSSLFTYLVHIITIYRESSFPGKGLLLHSYVVRGKVKSSSGAFWAWKIISLNYSSSQRQWDNKYCSAIDLTGFPGCASSKKPSCQFRRHERSRFHLCVRKIPWRRTWQPTLVFLPGKSHGKRSLADNSPRGCKESNSTELSRQAST